MTPRPRSAPTGRPLRRLAVALAAATLLAVGCGGSSAGGSPSAGAPSALPAGTYTSQVFKPAVTFTLPAGWDNPADSEAYFQIRPAGSDVAGIHLFKAPKPASQDTTCPETAQAGVGATSKELVSWIQGLPGLVASDPTPVTIGGLSGVTMDIGVKDGWTTSCPFANGLPAVPLFVGAKGEYRWVIAGSERLRLAVLDSPTGTVVVDVDAFDGSVIDGLIAAAEPIVKTFSFAP